MKTLRHLFFAAALSLAATPPAQAQGPGSLDTLNTAFSGAGGWVRATAVQPDEKVIIGGSFTTAGGVTRYNIARLFADGSVDTSFTASTNGNVYSVAVQADGKILLGGDFTSVNGSPLSGTTGVNRIARLNADGTRDTAFNASGAVGLGGTNSSVLSLVVQPDGKILLGGHFTSVNGSAVSTTTGVNHIARLNADGTRDMAFNASGGVGLGGTNDGVDSVALQADGKILLGGNFTSVNGSAVSTTTGVNYIARLNADGTRDTAFNASSGVGLGGTNWFVHSVAMQADGKILLGGLFTSVNGSAVSTTTGVNRIARLNADGTRDSAFNVSGGVGLGGTNSSVLSVAVQADGKILLGGNFTSVNGSAVSTTTGVNYIARLNADGTRDSAFNVSGGVGLGGTNSSVHSVALQADGKILLGGYFSSVNGTGRSRIARLNNDAALQMILYAPDTSRVLWNRSGAGPELTAVTFDLSHDAGVTWTALGDGTRVGTTADWQLTGLSLPTNGGALRARGRTAGGQVGGSSGLIERVVLIAGVPPPAPTVTGISPNFGHTAGGTNVTITGTGFTGVLGVSIGGLTASVVAATDTSLVVTLPPHAAGAVSVVVSTPSGTNAANSLFTYEFVQPPFVSTPTSTNVSTAVATLGGTVSFTTHSILERGVVLAPTAANANPVIDGPDVIKLTAVPNAGGGAFAVTFASLTPNTAYTFKAYATNIGGTGYTSATAFTTSAADPAGILDPTFGFSGKNFHDIKPSDQAYAMAVQPDGSVVMTGETLDASGVRKLALVRFTAEGSIDSSFGNAGSTTLDIRSWGTGLTILGNGKILVTGWVFADNHTDHPMMARFNSNGTLDTSFITSFGTGIRRMYDIGFGSPPFAPSSIVELPDGRILVAGVYGDGPNDFSGYIVARFTAGGELDTAFGTSGRVVTPGYHAGFYENTLGMALQDDGKIIVAGGGGGFRFKVLRFTPDGVLDSSFGTGGHAAPAPPTGLDKSARTVVIQPDGMILVAGGRQSQHDAASLVRYTAAGQVDTSFGTGGGVEDMALNGSGLALQADGKILMTGSFGVGRFTSTGAPDLNFGTNGKVTTPLGPNYPWAVGVVVQPSGRIFVGGSTGGYGYVTSTAWSDFVVVRYTGGQTPPAVANPTIGAPTETTAVLGGEVLNVGTSAIIERGVLYSEAAVNSAPVLGGPGVTQTATSGTTGVFTVNVPAVNVPALKAHTQYVFKAYAINGAGGGLSGAGSFTTGNSLPIAPAGTAAGTTGDPQTLTINFPATDGDGDAVTMTGAASGIGVTVDSFTGTTVTFTPNADFTGSCSFSYTVSDAFGGTNVGTITVTVTDDDAPETTITSTQPTPTNSQSASITFTGADNVDVTSFEGSLDGAAFATVTSPVSLSGLSDGAHTYEVRAKDAAANVDPTPASVTWVVETGDPNTTITSTQPAATNSTSTSITFIGTDDVAVTSFEGRLDGAPFATVTSPVSLTGLNGGSHTYEVRAKDTNGNVDPSPASVAWLVDTVAPTFDLPSPITAEASSPNGAEVTYSASADDSGSGVATSSFDPASGDIFALGTTTVNATAIDYAGNTATGSFTVTVQDTTDPVVTVPANISVAATSASGAVVSFNVSAMDIVDGSVTATPDHPSGSTFPIGLTTVQVTATDAHSNTGSGSFTVTVYNTTPVVAVAASGGPATFSATGSLATGRSGHTATLLPSGKVLVVGGSAFNVVASAELYDPASGTWTPTAPLATARGYHMATLLPNGKVLVAGGSNGSSAFTSAELYDPASGTWTATAPLATARTIATATLLPNGKVLVAGGQGIGFSSLASAELYDPASGTWTATGSLATIRSIHTATLLPNGKVLVAGGSNGNNRLSSAELYDPASGTWSPTGSLATPRDSHTATLLPNGKVLVTGGVGLTYFASAELYDPASGTWSPTGSLAAARGAHTASLLPTGKVLVAAGFQPSGYLASAEIYDPAAGTWTSTGSLAAARWYHTATLLPNGKVLVAGGGNSGGSSRSAELYDPTRLTAAEGSVATHTGTFSDAEGNATVTLTASSGAVTQNNAAGTWNWTATGTDGPSTQTVTITATDVADATATASFTFTVTNVPPSFDLGVNVTLPVGSGALSRSVGFADPGADTWLGTVNYGDGTGPQALSVNAGAKTFALSHTYATSGTFTVSVTLNDDDGGSITDTYTVTTLLNRAPTITSNGGGATAAINVAENTTAVTTVTANDIDLPAQALTYSITGGVDQALFSIVPGIGALTFITAPDFEGPHDSSYSVTVTATDDGSPNYADSQDITITVTDVNEMPSFVKGADQLLPYNTSSAQTSTGWATAINDGDSTVTQALTFNISSNSNPGLFTTGPSIDSSTGALTYTPNGTAGTATIGVTLTDDNTINGNAALTSGVQTFTITVEPVPDYTVATAGNVIVVTDLSGNGDTLAVTEPSAGNIQFAAAGRTFNVNGGLQIVGNSGAITRTSVTAITVNAAAGTDTINVGAFTGTLPSLTVNGGTGNDTVNFNGDITFAANANLDLDLQNDDVTPGTDTVNVATGVNILTSGTGTITVKVSRNIALLSGSSFETVNGGITLEANQQAMASGGNISGILTSNSLIRSTGLGNITLKGNGGNTGTFCEGVLLSNSTLVFAQSGQILVIGSGGTGTQYNNGIEIGNGTTVRAVNGSILLNGTGGGAAGLNKGVLIWNMGSVSSIGSAPISITGVGGDGLTVGGNDGVRLDSNGVSASITSVGGSIQIDSTPGQGSSNGFSMVGPASITGTGLAALTVTSDSDDIDAASSINLGASEVTLKPKTADRSINLGSVDTLTVLGLTDAELDRITAGTLVIGDSTSGAITVSAAISRSAATVLNFDSGANIDLTTGSLDSAGGNVTLNPGTHVFASNSGVDVTTGAAASLTIPSGDTLRIVIDGATADSGYTQLNVAGLIDLTGAVLSLSGGYALLPNDILTIVNNDSSDAITGTFSGLAEGAEITFNGIPLTISYVGGSGNDVTLSYLNEIVVHNGSHGLAPELSDGQVAVVDFGSTAPNVASVRSFTVRNTGDSDLTISSITVPSGYTTNGAAATLASGTSYSFQVALDSGTPATYAGSIMINSDDLTEAAFDFSVTGTVVPAGGAPVVTIGSEVTGPGGTGSTVLGGPVGSTLYSLIGSPAINSSGVLASAVQIRHADASLHTGMMVGQPMVLIATDTQVAPSLPGVNHFNFGPPVINEAGHIAFIGEVRGGSITVNTNSRCLFSNASDGTLKLVARAGTNVGLTSNLKTIGNFSIGGDLVIFLGTLVDNSVVLFGWDANTGLRPLMRNGQSLDANGVTKTVKSFSVLENANASSGHGKDISVAPTGESLVSISVTFTDNSSGLVVGSFDGASDTGFGATYGASQQLADTYASPAVIPLARWNTFRSPGFDNTGNYYGFISQMVTNTLAGVSSTNNVGVFVDTAPGILTLQLRENDVATSTSGLVFSDFSDLVLGGGDYEFLVKGEVRGSGVVVNVNDKGLWAQHATNGLVLVAREGSEAPGVAGSTFFRLTQIALPGTAQPMFQASMKTGVGGVTTTNDTGLWVINEANEVKLAVREGDVLDVGGTDRTVTAITALLNGTTTGGALGRRVFLEDGQLTLLLNFSGGVQANAKVVVP